MALSRPFHDLDELLATLGSASQRLGGIDASEGAADNLSNGNRAEGLTLDELREVVQAFNVQTTMV